MKKTSKILLTVIVVVLLGIGISTFFKVNGSIGAPFWIFSCARA